MIAGILAATFEPPSTEDFVFGCWGPGLRVGGFDLCFNFIAALVVLTTIIVLVLFFVAFRKPKVVPGKFQLLMELGVQFVQENIAEPMLGNKATAFLPLLASFFFFILIGNLFEVVPGVNFSASSRVAIPLVAGAGLVVHLQHRGIRKHGFFGYLRHTTIIPEAPAILRYGLLMPIEFISNIIVRPITLTVRLTANFVAGHFLLAIFFLGTVFFLENGPKTWAFAALSFPLSLMLVGLELFVAALQAFIFAVLSASYIGQAMAEGH